MPRPRDPDRRDPHDLAGLRAANYYRVSNDGAGQEKSVRDQRYEGRAWAERAGVEVVIEAEDAGLSASEFARKERPGYRRLLSVIEAGRVDLLWVWALNRATRQAREYLDLAELCRAQGVRWVVGGRVYDLEDDDDTIGLDLHNLMDKRYSRRLSRDVRRGQGASAREGRPPGLVPYGYRRVYDQATRKFLRQEPDDGPGGTAPVVREIFERLAGGEPFNTIRRDLTARGVPSPGAVSRHQRPPASPRWSTRSLYVLARNRAYLAQRVYRGKVLEGVTAQWPPLVTERQFWAVQRLLTDPGRPRKRPELLRHLLSYQVRCAVCDAPMQAGRNTPARDSYEPVVTYSCSETRCASILASVLDRYVQARLLAWLADPDVLADLTRVDDTEAAAQAQADADRARVQLAEWRRLAEDGGIEPEDFASAARGARARIEEAERRMRASAVPSVVANLLGPDAPERWRRLELARQREVIRQVADIRVRPAGRGQRVHPAERVEWRWLLGPAPGPAVVAAGPLDPEEFYGRAGPVPGATAHAAVCEVCGRDFSSARSTRVCSGTCKVRRSSKRRQAREAAAGA